MKSIVDSLPAPTSTTKQAIQWQAASPTRQTDGDRFALPASGFVQFHLGNLGSTPIMHVEAMRTPEHHGLHLRDA